MGEHELICQGCIQKPFSLLFARYYLYPPFNSSLKFPSLLFLIIDLQPTLMHLYRYTHRERERERQKEREAERGRERERQKEWEAERGKERDRKQNCSKAEYEAGERDESGERDVCKQSVEMSGEKTSPILIAF